MGLENKIFHFFGYDIFRKDNDIYLLKFSRIILYNS